MAEKLTVRVGDYRTRDGRRITINRINVRTPRYTCEGLAYSPLSKKYLTEYWTASGKYYSEPDKSDPLDLIERISKDEEPLTIEVGSYYETRNGRVVHINSISDRDGDRQPCKGAIYHDDGRVDCRLNWTRSGKYYWEEGEDKLDLVKLIESPLESFINNIKSKEDVSTREQWDRLPNKKSLSGDEAMEAVQADGRKLKFCIEQTEELCIAAVLNFPLALAYVHKQTEYIVGAALQDGTSALKYVEERFLKPHYEPGEYVTRNGMIVVVGCNSPAKTGRYRGFLKSSNMYLEWDLSGKVLNDKIDGLDLLVKIHPDSIEKPEEKEEEEEELPSITVTVGRYLLRDGREAVVSCLREGHELYRAIGYIEGEQGSESWTITGSIYYDSTLPEDLVERIGDI